MNEFTVDYRQTPAEKSWGTVVKIRKLYITSETAQNPYDKRVYAAFYV